jgi:hypothetical protein
MAVRFDVAAASEEQANDGCPQQADRLPTTQLTKHSI